MELNDARHRRTYILNLLLGGAGAAFLVVFGTNAALNAQPILASVLLGTALIGVASLCWMHFSGRNEAGTIGISVSIFLAFTFLIAHGGVDHTGPLWCYPLALIIMLLLGIKKGAIALLILLLISVALMFWPDIPFVRAEYSWSFKTRFIASFCAMALMSSIYEYLRWTSERKYMAISANLERVSRTDPLTSLPNRRDMEECLEAQIASFVEHRMPFSVIMVDLDHFKQINDQFGHLAGDHLLRSISRLLESGVRHNDRISRWGGEEFLILLPDTRREQAIVVAEKLRRLVAGADLSQIGLSQSVTASFGIQSVDSDDDLDGLIEMADRMLYEAKRRGRNRVVAGSEDPEMPTPR